MTRFIVGERNFTLAIDVTKHDVHVRMGLGMLGRLHGIKVSQRRKLLVGEALRQLVEETDETEE